MDTKISKKGYLSIIFFLSQAMFLHVGLNQILNISLNDSIISILIASFLSIILLLLIINICNYKKDINLFKKIDSLYGKNIGKIINLILFILVNLYFIYLLWNTNNYVQNKYLDSTPNYIIILLFLIPVILCANNNMKVISKVSFSIFVVTFIIILFSTFSLFSSVDINNFKPLFNTSIKNILYSSIIYVSYFVTPTFMMIITPKNQINNSKNIEKEAIIFYLISSFNFLMLFIFIIGIFGIDLAKLYNYPEYSLMKKINYFNFIEHVENISTIEWLYCLFISNVISLNYIKEYLKYINLNKIYYIIIIINFILSLFIFKNTTIGYNFIKNYYLYIFFIPILLLIIISNIKIRNKN